MHVRRLIVFLTASVFASLFVLWQVMPLFRDRHLYSAYLESLLAATSSPLALDIFDFAVHDYASIFGGREPPAGFSEWVKMAQKDQCSTSANTYAQIYKDLDPWFRIGHIDPKLLTLLAKDSSMRRQSYKADGSDKGSYFMLHEVFIAGKVKAFDYLENTLDEPVILPATDSYTRMRYGHPKETLKHNSCLRSNYARDNITEVHSVFNHPFYFHSQNVFAPVMSQCKLKCYGDILMPMAMHHIRVAMEEVMNDTIPWEEKHDVLFWRGASNDGLRTSISQRGHRVRLIEWAEEYDARHPGSAFNTGESPIPATIFNGTRVDIGFNLLRQCHPESFCDSLKSKYKLKSFVHFNQTMQYKYLLVVDGNSWPNRLQTYLESNSVVLYNGIFVDWNIGLIQPWVHYVPVRIDLSDLEERLEWLKENDDKAREISRNARVLMERHRSNDVKQMSCYMGLVFIEYSRLYNA